MKVLQFLRRLVGTGGFWFTVYTLLVLALTAWGCYAFRDELMSEPGWPSATIQNVGLVSVGLIALGLAVWRSLVAKRQADIAQESLLNERFNRAVELLGRQEVHMRIGALYMVRDLALENPRKFGSPGTTLLLEFAIWAAARIRTEKAATIIRSDEDMRDWTVEGFHERLSDFVKQASWPSARGLDYRLALSAVCRILDETRKEGAIGDSEYHRKSSAVTRLAESWKKNLREREEEGEEVVELEGPMLFQRRVAPEE